MKAEIIAVGTELISGDIANTNAQYLSRRLLDLGIEVHYHVALDDNAARLKRALTQAVSRSDIILVTGGLGPTPDDLTKETICQALSIDLVEHRPSLEQMKRYFDRIGREMTPINHKQVMMPAGATVFPNDVGTAPGCAMEADSQCIILLPGPPRELKPMFENVCFDLPQPLSRRGDRHPYGERIRHGGICHRRKAGGSPALEQPVVATYVSDGEVRIKITAAGDKTDTCEAQCREIMQTICERLGDAVYGMDQPNLETAVVSLLHRQNKKLAVAESCTAGLLSKRITDIPGSSEVFECGVTTYSNTMKTTLLGVSPKFLEENGAVSEIVAQEMARGVLRTSHAGISLAITGIAGPGGGTPEKPVGLVWLALTDGKSIWTRKILVGHGGNDRDLIRTLASSHALDMARQYLDGCPSFMEQGKPLARASDPGAAGVQSDDWDYDADRLLGDKQEESPAKKQKLPWYTRLRRYLFPVKGDRPAEVVRKIVFLTAVLCFLVAGGFIINYYVDTLRYNSTKPVLPGSGNVTSRDPSVPAEITDRFAELWMQNNDIKGWLTIPNTKTNNPVVQSSTDDPEYYLKRSFDQSSNRYGTIFMDSRNVFNRDAMSQNLVLYGHNMKDGEMLGEAQKKYRQLSFYKENPVIQFNSAYQEEDLYWKVFAVFITNAFSAQDNGYVFPYTQTDFSSEDEFMTWIDQVQSRSLYHTAVDIQPTDRILTLSTCTYEITDGRLVIMARLVREGESTLVDVSSASTNKNIVYPQAWCDKYNISKVSEAAKVSTAPPVPSKVEPSSAPDDKPSSQPASSRPTNSNSRPNVSEGEPPVVTSTPPPDNTSSANAPEPIPSDVSTAVSEVSSGAEPPAESSEATVSSEPPAPSSQPEPPSSIPPEPEPPSSDAPPAESPAA